MIHQKANAEWLGNLTVGKGTISTPSGSLKRAPYTFATRFGSESGTNPEELIAAAHASCYSMALAAELHKINFTADSIKVEAQVSLENSVKDGWRITNVHLDAEAVILGCIPEMFEIAANTAKTKCPVSQLLRAEITLDARLISLPTEVFEHGPT